MNRRRKIFVVDEVLNTTKWEFLAAIRSLPDDAVIHRIGELDYPAQGSYIVVTSDAFDEVPEYMRAPEESFVITDTQVKFERQTSEQMHDHAHDMGLEFNGAIFDEMVNESSTCICDMEYTGLTSHKYECPQRKR